MSTPINDKKADASTKNATTNSELWEKAEFNRFGIIPLLLLVISCFGGVAAAYGAGNSMFQIALVIFPTIITLAFMLAVAPMRLIVWTSACALILDILVFII
jgi:hypothetical protein